MASRALLPVLALLLAPVSAEARQHHPARGHRIVAATGAPLDGFTTPAAAYSFRKLKSSYAGPAIRIRRASDNAELDIGFLDCTGFTGCPWDSAAAVAHCNATTCFARTWYDQSGVALDLGNAGAAAQPQLIFNCWGTLPCLQTTANTQSLGTTSQAPVSPVTFSGVAERTVGTGFCLLRQAGSNNALQSVSAVANQWSASGTGSVVATAADATRHAMVALLNGASSVMRVDATETTGTATANLTANVWQIAGAAAGTTCKFGEFVIWNGYAVPAPERTVLQANQKSFWVTP